MTHDFSRRGLLSGTGLLATSALLPAPLWAAAKKVAPHPPLSLDFKPLELKLTHTWTLSRNSSDEKKNGLVTLRAEGETGYGEAAANKRWNQSYDTAEAAFARIHRAVDGLSPWEHLTWLERAEKEAGVDTEVVAALDMALWDWKGKRLGRPVHQLLGIPTGRMPVTSFSIGIDTAEVMKAKVKEAEAYPLLKVKLGLANDEENLAAIRSVTSKTLRVDPNEGWKDPQQTIQKIAWLKTMGVEFLEQPMPSSQNADMKAVHAASALPILADESVVHASDAPALVGLFDGIVVKLQKSGGITRAYELAALCRALGFKLMLGCMIESSLGIAAGIAVAPLFDWIDLDGNLLIKNDPFKGLKMEKGRWELPSAPGLGVFPI